MINLDEKPNFSDIFKLLDLGKLNSRNVKSMFTIDTSSFNGISSVELLHKHTGARVGNSSVRLLENANSNVYIQSLAKLNTDLQGKAFKERGYKNPKLAFSMLKEQLRNTKDNFNFDKRNFIGPMNLMKVQDKLGDISGFASTNEKLIGTSQDAMNFWKSKKVNTFFRRLGFKRHIISSKDLESEIPSTVAFEFPKDFGNIRNKAEINSLALNSLTKKVTNVSNEVFNVFHGTTRDKPAFMINGFDIFKEMGKNKLVLGAGHYFSDSLNIAETYAKGEHGNIFKVAINGNILDLRKNFFNTEEDISSLSKFHGLLGGEENVRSFLKKGGAEGYSGVNLLNRMAHGFIGREGATPHSHLNSELLSMGYDGVAVLKRPEHGLREGNTILNIFNQSAIGEIDHIQKATGTVAVNEIKTITTGAARLANRPAIEATMNIASNAVKSAGGLTGKGYTYKILSKVLK